MTRRLVSWKSAVVLAVLTAACGTAAQPGAHTAGPAGSVGDARTADSSPASAPAKAVKPSRPDFSKVAVTSPEQPPENPPSQPPHQPAQEPPVPPPPGQTPTAPDAKPGLPTDRAPTLAEIAAALPLRVHPSQFRVAGPCYFVEISQARFVSPTNPRGWAWPYSKDLPARGWSVLLGDLTKAAQSGYSSVWLWEPTGQYEGIGGCMAWFSRKSVEDGWTLRMKETFPTFIRTVRERLNMEVIFYSGCAQHINVGSTLQPEQRAVTEAEIPHIIDAMRYAVELGISGVGMDGFSLLQDKDPATSVKVIWAIRQDSLAKDLILACEGWPFPDGAQPYLQQQMVSLDMLRGPHSVSEEAFAKFFSRVNNERERQAVPGRVGIFLLHGANWQDAQVAKAYQLIRQHGMIPMDSHHDAPRKYWVVR